MSFVYITEVYSSVVDVLQKRHGIRAQFGDSIHKRSRFAGVGQVWIGENFQISEQ
jgi:hypothetical protein